MLNLGGDVRNYPVNASADAIANFHQNSMFYEAMLNLFDWLGDFSWQDYIYCANTYAIG